MNIPRRRRPLTQLRHLLASITVACTACSGEPASSVAGAGAAPAVSADATTEPTPPASPTGSNPPIGTPQTSPTADDLTAPDATALRILRESEAGLPIIAIEIAGTRYEVELAATNASRMRGMGGRDRFPAGTAMLFVHDDDMHRNYWMKDCLVAMDIAFLDRQGRIVAMHRMPLEAPQAAGERPADYHGRLRRYPSRRHARYALEVPYGDLKRLGLRVGQDLPLPRAPLDELAAREAISARR